MKFGPIVVLVVGLPLAAMSAAQAAETSDSSTAQSEAQYKTCLKEAKALQQRYSECTTKECSDLVTKDFQAWSAKCFKE
jgi:hypothetical protein